MRYLFRNTHAIVKYNRPITDYVWLCSLDKAKGIDIGSTYVNKQAPVDFIHCISKCEKTLSMNIFNKTPFFAFMMDGTTDISGSEQETIYVRGVIKGKISERFLNIGFHAIFFNQSYLLDRLKSN